MKPWREVAVPYRDVLEGSFQQSEFAADIMAVNAGKPAREYQDAVAFFARTFITEGMRLLLTQVAQRLAGRGGEPVVQVQTAFGAARRTPCLRSMAQITGYPHTLQGPDISP